jgi:hypothetical protein
MLTSVLDSGTAVPFLPSQIYIVEKPAPPARENCEENWMLYIPVVETVMRELSTIETPFAKDVVSNVITFASGGVSPIPALVCVLLSWNIP